MGDVKKRLATVRKRRFNKYGDFNSDLSFYDALRRAEEYFGTKDHLALAMAMAEVLFPAPGRGRKKGKIWNDSKHLQLGEAYMELRRKNPRMKDTKIAEIISKDPDFKEYRNNPELLRQRLKEAKSQYWRRIDDIADSVEPPEGWEEEQEALAADHDYGD